MFKLNLMKWLWNFNNSGTFWHIERLCYDRTMVINYLHLTHKDITTSQCKMYNLVMISGCCRCEQAMFEQCYETIFIVTCLLFETISLRIGWWGTSCQSSADKLQSAPFFWRQRFLKLFKRVSQIVFSTGRVRFPFTPCLKISFTDGSLWWVRKLKTCPTLTRGSAKICRDRYQRKKEKVGTTYFLSWKIGLGSQWESYLDQREGGEWQSGSQRANVHSYSAHNETCPSSKIAFDVRCSPGLSR